MTPALEIHVVPGLPEVKPGDDLAAIIGDCLEQSGLGLRDGDIVTSAHKIVSKAEGRVVRLADVTPSDEALDYAERLAKDARKVEVVLRESVRVVKAFRHPGQNEGTMICEHRLGFISANAAVDESNTGEEGTVILLPQDPDHSAQRIRDGLERRFGVAIGVMLIDTFGRPWRLGQVNIAIGLAGIPAVRSEKGKTDAYGRRLMVTEPAFADEIAAASGLVVHKAAGTPVALFRGLDWEKSQSRAADLLRPAGEDMFR